jgi:hypothetical protein
VASRLSGESALPSRWVDFYELTKPRMNFLVLVTTLVGFYMATGANTAINWALLLPTLVGTALCAAGASVLNQFVERDLDALMPRTRNRPIPGGRITPNEGFITGVTLGIAGFVTLLLCVNFLTALLGGATLLSYVLVYTPLKRENDAQHGHRRDPGRDPAGHGASPPSTARSPPPPSRSSRSCSSGRCRTSWRSRSCTSAITAWRGSRCCRLSTKPSR